MGFNNYYIVEGKDLTDVLSQTEEIMSDLQKIQNRYSGYSINVELHNSTEDKVYAEINIRYEQEDKEGVKDSIEPPTLL